MENKINPICDFCHRPFKQKKENQVLCYQEGCISFGMHHSPRITRKTDVYQCISKIRDLFFEKLDLENYFLIYFDKLCDLYFQKNGALRGNNPRGIAGAAIYLIMDGTLSQSKITNIMTKEGFKIIDVTLRHYYRVFLELDAKNLHEIRINHDWITRKANQIFSEYEMGDFLGINVMQFPVHDMPIKKRYENLVVRKLKLKKRSQKSGKRHVHRQPKSFYFDYQGIFSKELPIQISYPEIEERSIEERIANGDARLSLQPKENKIYIISRVFDKPYNKCLALNCYNTIFCYVCNQYLTNKQKARNHARNYHPDLLDFEIL